MKSIFLILILIPFLGIAQGKSGTGKFSLHGSYTKNSSDLTLEGALELSAVAVQLASESGKQVSVAVLDSDGLIILMLRGDAIGIHNTEASRRKAYTAVSTRTATFELMQKAAGDPTAYNLNTMPELLLLGGGVPVWNKDELIGSIGVSGAGGGLNDHNIAKLAIERLGFDTTKK